jgi:hypothetical protein
MQFIASTLAALAVLSCALGAPVVESPFIGSINAPTANTPIQAESSFPFSYTVDNWCEEGYNNFKVFLTKSEPTIADVDGSGNIPGALVNFGQFTVANFGK